MYYLFVGFGLTLISSFLWTVFLVRKKTPKIINQTNPGLSLQISRFGNPTQTLTLPAGRISCGFSTDFTINLAHYIKPGLISGSALSEELSFELIGLGLAVKARTKLLMNGVERSSGTIPIGGSLLYKTCRFTFLGPLDIYQEKSVYPDKQSIRKLALPPVVATLATLIVLVFGLLKSGTPDNIIKPGPKVAALAQQETGPLPASDTLPYPAPQLIGPGEPIPQDSVDVLFIHAHPDDESIDFGTLMALCRDAGLTTGTILFTDGESGIYQQDYAGPRDNLVSTRIQEAIRAMQFLGSKVYIRLGLRNSPYNSLLEEKGVSEVLRIWDGAAVASQLADIINTLSPRVVVSPEGPSFAREHFEHETTGVLVRMAIQQLRLSGGHVPEAHLVSIDPRQKDAYTELIAFPRQRVLERQRQALLSHASQADSSYFGIQMIDMFRNEYYLIQYRDSDIHFANYFGLQQ